MLNATQAKELSIVGAQNVQIEQEKRRQDASNARSDELRQKLPQLAKELEDAIKSAAGRGKHETQSSFSITERDCVPNADFGNLKAKDLLPPLRELVSQFENADYKVRLKYDLEQGETAYYELILSW